MVGEPAAPPAARYEIAATHPAAIVNWARRDPDGIWVRFVRDGTVHEWRRTEFVGRIGRVAAALARAGLARGDRVGIVGASSPEWVAVAEGVQSAGGVTVGAYPTSAPPQLAYVFGHAGARFVFVSDAALAEKVCSVRDELPALERIIAMQPGATDLPAGVETLDAFLESAAMDDAAALGHLEQQVATLQPDDLCTIVYTSGTTGQPKGALHSFRTIGQVADTVGPAMGYGPDDEYIVHLPLNHTAEQTYTIVLGAQVGWTLNFAQSIATLPDDLRRFRPTVMFGVPRIFEKVREAIEQGGGESGDSLAPFGLDRLRIAVCGGAPLARELVEFFAARGLKMCNTYGMTEAGAIASAWDRPPRGDTCGAPFPGVELRVADDGEFLVRSHGVCLGYYRDPNATAEMFTEDRFLRTGDVGVIDPDGEVRILDRKKDIIITAGGKNISPSAVEHCLTRSPYLNHAVVIGNDRRYLVALLELAPDAVREYLAAKGIDAGEYAEMIALPEVQELVANEVARANEDLSRPEQVKRWALLPKPLLPTDPEMTPTMKVKRRPFEERYRDLIESLYE